MIISRGNLTTLYTGFNGAFQAGFDGVKPLYRRVAQVVPSSTRANEYGWLGQFPRMREWIGDRVVNNMETHGYTIKNRSFETTIGVNRDDIADDNIGIYGGMFTEFGRLAAVFPDELVWSLIQAGFTTVCFDGQYFFDTDHPMLDAFGKEVYYANTDGGNGDPWFLIDASRAIKPLIFQDRQPFNLVRMDQDTDEVVFNRKEFRYGTDGRCNVGYSFPQLAWGSKQPLDAAHYEAARVNLSSMKGDYGRPLGITPNLLIVGPSNEGQARRLINNENDALGATNPWKGTAELIVSPWLA